jgi:uncharacterized membrane protein YfcA
MTTPLQFAVSFAASFAAGAINSVAGGGTLVSFPSLIWLGLPSIVANATSTVAIWPGSLGGMWGFRRELRGIQPSMLALAVPSLIGGITGAVLLQVTPTKVFDRLVPLLILFATLLFLAQDPLQRLLARRRERTAAATERGEEPSGISWLSGAMLAQLAVGLYGGYFGAGIGILMLAVLGILGLTDIHQMNALKNLLALCINGVAAIYFIAMGMVSWQFAIVMAIGAIAGGIGGAGLARKLGRTAVRRIVIAIGFGMSFSLMLR